MARKLHPKYSVKFAKLIEELNVLDSAQWRQKDHLTKAVKTVCETCRKTVYRTEECKEDVVNVLDLDIEQPNVFL